MTKEELLQDWLPRLWAALKDVRCNENFAAQEALYELYVEMKQQTLAEKMSTFSEITLEDQMSAMAIELLASQKRVANLELGICQRAFEAKQEQGEPVAYDIRCDNCGGDGYDLKDNNYFCSSCEGSGFLEKLLYITPQQRTWVGLTESDRRLINFQWQDGNGTATEIIDLVEAKLKEKNT